MNGCTRLGERLLWLSSHQWYSTKSACRLQAIMPLPLATPHCCLALQPCPDLFSYERSLGSTRSRQIAVTAVIDPPSYVVEQCA